MYRQWRISISNISLGFTNYWSVVAPFIFTTWTTVLFYAWTWPSTSNDEPIGERLPDRQSTTSKLSALAMTVATFPHNGCYSVRGMDRTWYRVCSLSLTVQTERVSNKYMLWSFLSSYFKRCLQGLSALFYSLFSATFWCNHCGLGSN